MRKVRTPAQGVIRLAGRFTPSRLDIHQNAVIITDDANSLLVKSFNYCNHSRFQPKLFIVPSNHKPRAKIVQETYRKLEHAYHHPKSSLKTLQFHDQSGHRVKSQRREAAISLLQVMNYYQDDSTGRIGRFTQGGTFRDLSLKKLANHARINLRRAKRAMGDIVRAGYIDVSRRYNRNETTGEVKGIPSMRSFLPKFFIDLDVKGAIWQKWFSQRDWAKQRSDKKITKQERSKARAMMSLIKHKVGSLGKKAIGVVKTVPKPETSLQQTGRQEKEKSLIHHAMQLFNEDPSQSLSEYYQALKLSHPDGIKQT